MNPPQVSRFALPVVFVAAIFCAWDFAARAEEAASEKPILRIEAGMHTASIKCISADAAGKLALTVSDDLTARLWELPTGRLLRVLRPPIGEDVWRSYSVSDGTLSPDGRLAAVGGKFDDFSVYLFDTASGRLERRLSLPSSPTEATQGTLRLAFSTQGRFLAQTLFGGNDGLRVWETATGREVGRDIGFRSKCVDWHGEERLVTKGMEGSLRLYEIQQASLGASSETDARGRLALLSKATVRGGKNPRSVRFTSDGRRIAVGFSDSAKLAVVDGGSLSFLYAPDTTGVDNGNLWSVTWTDDGATLAAGGTWTTKSGETLIRRWPELGRGRPRDTVVAGDAIFDMCPLPGGRILFAAADPAWGLIEGGKREFLGAPPNADYRNLGEGFRLSADGATVAFGYECFGKVPARFSLTGRELNVETASSRLPEPEGGWKLPLRSSLPIDWENTTAPKFAGKPLARFDEMSRSLAIASDAGFFVLGGERNLHRYNAEGGVARG